ncbi:ribonuclease P/MRP subunit POP4 [Tachypleus tridentatus]|uniref:ribonuclease P/MRP subunit POP4 n=1 Tax=Tachypleus tridentatus TaxID=6853 RepID=UPI003FD2B2EF
MSDSPFLKPDDESVTGSVFKDLPLSIFNQDGTLKNVSNKFVSTFLKNRVDPNLLNLEELSKYTFPLEQIRVKKKKCSKKRQQLLSVSEKKQLGLFKINTKKLKFDDFVPIHNLWVQYMDEVIQKSSDPSQLHQKLMKADYHGCFLVVCAARCSSYVGVSGIVIQETRNTFKLITNKNKVTIIPKRNTNFAFQHNGKFYKIVGNNFQSLTYERAKGKQKQAKCMDV